MHDNDSLFPIADAHGRLECKEWRLADIMTGKIAESKLLSFR